MRLGKGCIRPWLTIASLSLMKGDLQRVKGAVKGYITGVM